MARRWLMVLVLAAGCGSDPEVRAPPDGGADAPMDAADDGRSVQVGTGSDRFVPISEGETLSLDVGPQGGGRFDGYHIFAAMRVEGFAPNRILGTFQILDADGALQAEQSRRFPRLQPDGDGYVAYAVAPRLMDCCAVEGRQVILRVEVVDEEGFAGRDERIVVAGPRCEDPDRPGTSICD